MNQHRETAREDTTDKPWVAHFHWSKTPQVGICQEGIYRAMNPPNLSPRQHNTTADSCFRLDQVLVPTRAPWNIRITARLRRLPLIHASAGWNSWCDRLAASRLLPHRGTFTYRRAGREYRIPFDARNAQFEAIHDPLYSNGYEPETSLLLARLSAGPGCFFDVGANWGYFALLVSAAPGFCGKIHAFEPNPVGRADLVRTVEAAGLEDSVTCHAMALSDVGGTANFSGGRNFRTGLAGLSKSRPGHSVAVQRLDDLALPSPTCMKIDVEGAEAAVLRGAERVLRAARPHVLIENFLNRDDPEDTLEPLMLLEAARYRLFVPALALRWQGADVFTAYWTHIPSLLSTQPTPPIRLIPMRATERFLFGHHLNLFACAAERVTALASIPGIQIGDAP